MRSFWTSRAHPSYQTRIYPALTSFADECTATLARLLAYVGTLALVAMLGIHLWDQLPVDESNEPPAKAGWSLADRSHPAFAVSQSDLLEKTESYEIFRHPLGGRRANGAQRSARAGSRRRHRQQIRRGDAAARSRRGRLLPRLPQASRRSQSADLRLVLPRRRLAGAAGGGRLHAEPADPAHGRK